jgi:hypothetical protein
MLALILGLYLVHQFSSRASGGPIKLFGLDREPGFDPCVEPADQRVNVSISPAFQKLRHTGA